jgi:hypothetical protein
VQSLKSISPKGFTLGVKAEKETIFLIYHIMAWTWHKCIKRILINMGGQFATIGVNVAAIKYCCFYKIHTRR